jgi:multidrug resistance protein, MATE family
MRGPFEGAAPSAAPVEITHRRVLGIAVPMMLANVSTPMLGIADTAVIGQLGVAHLLAGVALGAVIFDFVFWPFAFLRMGTTGLTAQAVGAGDGPEERAALFRALLLALVCGLVIVALQAPIAWAAFGLIEGSAATEAAAKSYFDIRVWSAPVTFANFAILGWFLGRGQAGIGLLLTVFLNGVNIACNLVFVLGLGWGVEGTAAGTIVGEAATLVLGIVLVLRTLRPWPGIDRAVVLDRTKLVATMVLNRDVFVRTLALIFVFTFFAAQGARSGDAILAANAVLHNLALTGAYLLDGFATAAEQLGGVAVGARDRRAFDRATWLSSLWAVGISLVLSLGFLAGGDALIDAMTKSSEVRETAREFLPYAAAIPVVGAMAYIFDGIYIGATWSVAMRNLIVAAVAVFLLAWAILMPAFGNHGLWAALLLFLGARVVGQGVLYRHLRRRTFPD